MSSLSSVSITVPRPAPSPESLRLQAWLAWLAVSFFWGTTYLAIRIGVRTMPPALFAASRFLAAGLILWAVRRAMGDRNPEGREWGSLTLVGVLLLVVGNGLVVTAERWVESGLTALAVSLMPIWTAVLSAFLPDGERLTLRGAAGLLLGIAGLFLLLYPTSGAPSAGVSHQVIGMVLLEVACLCWAAGSLYSKHQKLGVSPLMGAAIQMATAGFILAAISGLRGEWSSIQVTGQGMASLAYLVVFGSLVGYGAYMFALAHLRATTVSLYAYVNPVVALLAGALILHEPLTPFKLAAAGIILSGVALAKSGVRARQPSG